MLRMSSRVNSNYFKVTKQYYFDHFFFQNESQRVEGWFTLGYGLRGSTRLDPEIKKMIKTMLF